jgi:hypothetical protein
LLSAAERPADVRSRRACAVMREELLVRVVLLHVRVEAHILVEVVRVA